MVRDRDPPVGPDEALRVELLRPVPKILVAQDVIVEREDEAVLRQRPRLQPRAAPRRAVGDAARHHVEQPHRLEDERLRSCGT